MSNIEINDDLGWKNRCLSCYRPPSNWVSAPSPKAYLLQLPLEIRTDILERVLLSHGGNQPIKADILTGRVRLVDRRDTLYVEYLNSYQKGLKPKPNPTVVAHKGFNALSLTCSQLYQESTSIFFGKNRFCFQDVFGMSVFLGNISQNQRSKITEVLFPFTHLKSDEHEWAFKLLQECPLRKLTMGIRLVCIDHYYYKAENFLKQDEVKCLRGIRGWKEVEFKVFEVCCWMQDELDWHAAVSRQGSSEEDEKLIFEFLRDVQVSLKSEFSKKAKRSGSAGGPGRQTRAMQKKLEGKASARGARWTREELDEDESDIMGGEKISMCASCKQKQEAEKK